MKFDGKKIKVGCIGNTVYLPEYIFHNESFSLQFIVCEDDRLSEELYNYSVVRGIELFPVSTASAIENLLDKFDVDILLMFSFGKKIRPELINKIDIFNIHFGLLPNYKSRHPLFWAIYGNEKRIGISLHQVDGKMDTGDIISQRTVPNYFWENESDIFNKLHKEIPFLLTDLVTRPEKKVANKEGSYFKPVTEKDLTVDFSIHKPRDIYNIAKAQYRYKGALFTLNKATKIWVKELMFIKNDEEHIEKGNYKIENGALFIGFNEELKIKSWNFKIEGQ
jgi:methionyl-tRNA formyltransferase